MGRKVKQFKNYTTGQVEAIFKSSKNNLASVKLYAIIQLIRGCSTYRLEEFFRVTHRQISTILPCFPNCLPRPLTVVSWIPSIRLSWSA
ncbi:MAG: hypothetical protein LBE91_05570 [Tannerella sp.]|jgi:hypothetical protein|nr:hypothetical protein [Tannerella sp.]